MDKTTYIIGFDGGGTKTECVLQDASGKILAHGVAGPSNPLRIGFDEAFMSLTTATDHVLSAARLEARQINAVCAGLAGAGQRRVLKRVTAFLVDTFPEADVHVTTDFEVALEAAVGPNQGVVLIAGTGSSAYGRNAEGKTARAGGHGPWVGDEGSAFDIGRRAVKAIAQARDSVAPVTLLAETVPAALEVPSWDALIERIAQAPDEVFPRVFPLVVEAADHGDGPAHEILFSAAMGLGAIAVSVIRRLDLEGREFTLAKAGGVFGHSAYLDNALDAVITSGASKVKIEPLEVPPAVGAARLAKRLVAGSSKHAAHGAKS